MRCRNAYVGSVIVAVALCPLLGHAEHVATVIDGDTITLTSGETVRYIGIDAPESHHPSRPIEFLSEEATEANRALVAGQEIRLELDVQDRDRYGRLLAYVYVGDLFVNAELLRQGYARVLTVPPDVRHAADFLALEKEAREAGRGLWDAQSARAFRSAVPLTEGDKFYITKTGRKYHRGGCRSLSKSAIEITEAEAIAGGYGPCSICLGGSVRTPVPARPRDPPAQGRCQATTKKGTQCSRAAKSGSRYCWQHGG